MPRAFVWWDQAGVRGQLKLQIQAAAKEAAALSVDALREPPETVVVSCLLEFMPRCFFLGGLGASLGEPIQALRALGVR